jgi:hypothetical protein
MTGIFRDPRLSIFALAKSQTKIYLRPRTKQKTCRMAGVFLSWCARQDSNPEYQFRRLM